jgi:hypothetical protein
MAFAPGFAAVYRNPVLSRKLQRIARMHWMLGLP